MRLTRQQVMDRLKAGEELVDDGTMVKFKDGGHCNVFTFWWLRDKGLITLTPTPSWPRYWYWVK